MPKVPERPLSYGEILLKLKQVDKYKTRTKEQAKALKPRKHRQNKDKPQRHEYSYGEVMAHIRRIQNEE